MFLKNSSLGGVKNMFKKGLSTVSSASKTFGNVAQKVGKGLDVAQSVINDPTVQKLASSTPQGQKLLKGAQKVIGTASTGLQKAKDIQANVDKSVVKFSQ